MVLLDRARARAIYRQDLHAAQPGQGISHSISWQDFVASPFDATQKFAITYYTKAQRIAFVDEVCEKAWKAARDYDLSGLDDVFSDLLTVQWRPEQTTEDELVDAVMVYFSRCPEYSQQLPDDLGILSDAHFESLGTERSWHSLKINGLVSANLVRLAIYRVFTQLEPRKGWIKQTVQDLVNNVGEYIDLVVKKEKLADPCDRPAWRIVRIYLWTFWQLARTAFAADVLVGYIRFGFSHQEDKFLWFRNFHVAPNVSLRSFTEQKSLHKKPWNMCSWALELLRTDQFCLGLNFDAFHRRISSISDQWQCRCQKDLNKPCSGTHSDHCLRYKGAVVEEQSMHDKNCKVGNSSEPKLKWDKQSYATVEGPRAVDLSTTDDFTVRYCLATRDTIAISHVWSHGQGGRPENGINRCLHERYKTIALSLGCNSYWMDTTCIPEDHNLRQEAIEQINKVFHSSRAIVVCDRELMEIDLDGLTIDKQESILCAVMMSDWNVRAWTILEGLKGRENIFILCKRNQTLNLRSLFEEVAVRGRFDVFAFGHLLSHILPSMDARINARDSSRMPAEIAGAWLSHRPASRPGDDVVIWSLLLSPNSVPVANALEFWKRQETVQTGYLLSTAARLRDPGFSWAPSTPYAVPALPVTKKGVKHVRQLPKFHRPLSSMETEIAQVKHIGLVGTWYGFEFNVDNPLFSMLKIDNSIGGKFGNANEKLKLDTAVELDKVRKQFFKLNTIFSRGSMGKLLRPISHTVHFRFDGAADTPSSSRDGILLAVCESDCQETIDATQETKRTVTDVKNGEWSYKWRWRGVYEWPSHVPLPPMIEDGWVVIA